MSQEENVVCVSYLNSCYMDKYMYCYHSFISRKNHKWPRGIILLFESLKYLILPTCTKKLLGNWLQFLISFLLISACILKHLSCVFILALGTFSTLFTSSFCCLAVFKLSVLLITFCCLAFFEPAFSTISTLITYCCLAVFRPALDTFSTLITYCCPWTPLVPSLFRLQCVYLLQSTPLIE